MNIKHFIFKKIKQYSILCFSALSLSSIKAQTPLSTVNITVNQNSTAPTSIASSAANTLCFNGSTTLSLNGGSLGTAAKWYWYNENPSTNPSAVKLDSTATLTVTPDTTNSPNNITTTTYYVVAQGTCNTTTPISIAINVNPLPSFTAPDAANYCNNSNIAMQNIIGAASNITYTYTGGSDIGLADNTTGTATSIAAFTATNTTNAVITRTITVKAFIGTCEGEEKTFTITVNPTPAITSPNNAILCNGVIANAVTLNTSIQGQTYKYSGGADIGLIDDLTGTATTIPSFTATNSGATALTRTITITPTLGDCAGTTLSYSITVNPSPLGTITANSSICQDAPINLIFNATQGATPYELKIKETNASSSVDYPGIVSGVPFAITPIPSVGNHTYDLFKITDANGCVTGN
jgi:hypothetical protein